MRIAFVLLDAEVTGGQVVAHELMRAARAAGHEPLAIFPSDGPMVERLSADGIRTHRTALDRSYRLDQARGLARVLRAERIDLVNTHTLFVGNQLSRVAAKHAGAPLVAHAHIEERFSMRPGIGRAQQLLARRGARGIAAIVAVSEHVKRTLVFQGIPAEVITVVHNGVQIDPPSQPPPGGPLRLLCAARLAPVKGQAILLDALAQVDGVHATIAGDDLEHGGSYLRELTESVEALGLGGRVELVGRRDDISALLEQSHALALPSLDEGMPMAALEAMERGRAVIASAVGGTPELVVDAVTGLLVPPTDTLALAAAIRRLRDEPDLARTLGAAGRARVESGFTLEEMVAKTLDVFAAAAA